MKNYVITINDFDDEDGTFEDMISTIMTDIVSGYKSGIVGCSSTSWSIEEEDE